MKKLTFQTSGSFGRGDCWEGIFEFEVTDEEADRLAIATKGKNHYQARDFRDDEDVSDIYEKVYDAAYENELNNIIECQIDDLRWDYLQDEDNFEEMEYNDEIGAWIKRAKPFTDRDLAAEYFENSTFHVGYPEELLEK